MFALHTKPHKALLLDNFKPNNTGLLRGDKQTICDEKAIVKGKKVTEGGGNDAITSLP